MIFGVEALEDSREFSEARLDDDTVVQAATAGKETLLANLGPLVDLLDQYASVCNEVISLFAHVILRLFEMINNIGSPVELLSSFCIFLFTLLLSIFYLLVYEVVSLIVWPFRISLNLLVSHPFLLTLISLSLVLVCTAFLIIIKQIPIVQVGSAFVRFIAPRCSHLTHTFFLYFYPLLISIMHLFLLPVKFLWDVSISCIGIFSVPRLRRQRNYSSICGFDDVSRITCCICFIHEKSILLQPCNHICVCAYCVEGLLEAYEDPLCPLCRSIITSYVDVYI